MPVFVPNTRRAKWPLNVCAAAVWLSACLSGIGACTSTPTAVDDSGVVSGGITVKIKDPVIVEGGAPFGANFTVKGTYTLDKGVALKKTGAVSLAMGEKSAIPCTVISPGNFSCVVDTTGVDETGNPLIGCNESVTLTVIVNGILSGSDVAGTDAIDVEVDDCAPKIQLQALTAAGTDAGPTPVFVGTQKVRVLVSDNRLQSATLDVVDGNGTSILPPDGVRTMPTGQTTWYFDYVLDTTTHATTEKLSVVVTAKDETNDEVQKQLEVFSVKSATFLGNVHDSFNRHINDFVMPDPQTAPDGNVAFVAYTAEPTPTSGLDMLADVVVAADDGVHIRAGLPKRSGTVPITVKGEPVPDGNSDTLAHSLQFEDLSPGTLEQPNRLYWYRNIHHATDSEVAAKANANMKRVFLRDLDGDGDLDIIAVGIITGDGQPRGEVWAILNVAVPSTETMPPMRGFKVVQTLKLPSRPATAEMADLDGDGMDDLLIGALKEADDTGLEIDRGLMTLLLTQGPICKTPSDAAATTKPCSDPGVDYVTLQGGTVFAADVKIAPNMGVTGVVSIATGEFWDGDGLDVCVGSANRPILSCYRNVAKDGTLNQAQDVYQFKEGGDTSLLQAIDQTPGNAKDGTDLLVASATGEYLRWLKSIKNGQFTVIGNPVVPSRQIWGPKVSALTIAPVGPKGEPYVVANMWGQEVTLMPVAPDDNEMERACFRSWIIGGKSVRLLARDVDGDGVLDLLSANGTGIQSALAQTKGGKFTGSFIAPTVHHLCAGAWPPPGLWGVQELVAAKVADFNKDNKKELLMIGKECSSSQPNQLGNCLSDSGYHPMPVWPIAAFMNEGGQVNPEPRQTEFSPYNPALIKSAGFAQDCSKGSPSAFGRVKAAALADVNGDSIPDLVTVRTDSSYPIGRESVDDPKGCQCTFNEQNEVANSYGEDGPTGTDADLKMCCYNFAVDDPLKTAPLQGFGGGAPLPRASALVFLSSATGPLNMAAKCNSLPPQGGAGGTGVCTALPIFAFSAGRNPVDIHVMDVDGDKKPDVVTAMDNDGTNCFKVTPDFAPFLHSRVRVFQNKGGGFFAPTFISDSADKVVIRDKFQIPNCDYPLDVGITTVGYRLMPDEIKALAAGPWPNPKDGKNDPATIFGLARAFGQVGVLPHLDKFNYASRIIMPVGNTPDAFNAADINGDGITDLLVLSNVGKQVTILTGKLNNGSPKDAAFFPQTQLTVASATFPGAAAAAMGDFNKDGNLDLVLVGLDSSILFLLGTGVGTFVNYRGSDVGADAVALENADMDGDGCDDLIVRSKSSVTIIHNEGSGQGDCTGALTWAHDADISAAAP